MEGSVDFGEVSKAQNRGALNPHGFLVKNQLAKKATVLIPLDVNKSPPLQAMTKSQEEEDRSSAIVTEKELKFAELGRSPLIKAELERSSSRISLQPKSEVIWECKENAISLLCEVNNNIEDDLHLNQTTELNIKSGNQFVEKGKKIDKEIDSEPGEVIAESEEEEMESDDDENVFKEGVGP
ncbi:hypothetical protein U1Q18_028254, partial [Sarracenia purpurea var. burkii]